jgi:hypothetical protein
MVMRNMETKAREKVLKSSRDRWPKKVTPAMASGRVQGEDKREGSTA